MQRSLVSMAAAARAAHIVTHLRCSQSLSALSPRPQRCAFSSFSDSDSDEIFREIQALKKEQRASQLKEAERRGITITDTGLDYSALEHIELHSEMPKRPSGGPSVEAILKLRKTNRKVDQDEISQRFQRAMEYRKERQAAKGNVGGNQPKKLA